MRHRHAALAVQGRRRPLWGLLHAQTASLALQTLTAMLPHHAPAAPAVSMLLRARHRALTVGLVQLTWTLMHRQLAVLALLGSTQLLGRRLAVSVLQVRPT